MPLMLQAVASPVQSRTSKQVSNHVLVVEWYSYYFFPAFSGCPFSASVVDHLGHSSGGFSGGGHLTDAALNIVLLQKTQ